MGTSKEDLLILLNESQNKSGHLSQELMVELAKQLDVSIGDVYGVTTFYSFLYAKPQGRNIIRICKSIPCFLKNSDTIIDSIKKKLGINPGEITPDGRFSFELTNCIGACDKAPAMMINHDVHCDLTPRKITQILKKYR